MMPHGFLPGDMVVARSRGSHLNDFTIWSGPDVASGRGHDRRGAGIPRDLYPLLVTTMILGDWALLIALDPDPSVIMVFYQGMYGWMNASGLAVVTP
jgi:hypothetical protein